MAWRAEILFFDHHQLGSVKTWQGKRTCTLCPCLILFSLAFWQDISAATSTWRQSRQSVPRFVRSDLGAGQWTAVSFERCAHGRYHVPDGQQHVSIHLSPVSALSFFFQPPPQVLKCSQHCILSLVFCVSIASAMDRKSIHLLMLDTWKMNWGASEGKAVVTPETKQSLDRRWDLEIGAPEVLKITRLGKT